MIKWRTKKITKIKLNLISKTSSRSSSPTTNNKKLEVNRVKATLPILYTAIGEFNEINYFFIYRWMILFIYSFSNMCSGFIMVTFSSCAPLIADVKKPKLKISLDLRYKLICRWLDYPSIHFPVCSCKLSFSLRHW